MALRWLHANHQYIIAACLVALVMAVTVRLVAESLSGHSDQVKNLAGNVDAIEHRLRDLEDGKRAATAKRYTSEDAARDRAAIYACIKQRAACPD